MTSSFLPRFLLLTAALSLAACTLSAHQLWIGANQYLLKYPGTRPGPLTVNTYVTFGHRLPIDATLDDERFGGVTLLSAGKDPQKVSTASDGYRTATLKLDQPGAYWLISANRPIFSSQIKSADGVVSYVRAPKTDIPANSTLVDSTHIHGFAKTFLYVAGEGASDELVSKPAGHTIEIVPLKNPATLARGAALPVQVYFEGKPYAGEPIEVTADWEGAAASGTELWSAETDAKGQLSVPLRQSGIWQLVATIVVPAEGDLSKETNQIRYRSSLVFEVPGSKVRM